MNIKEFNSLELKDKVLYKGKILTVHTITTEFEFRGILFTHNNKTFYPSFSFDFFWEGILIHEEKIKLMTKIPNR